MIDIGLVVLGGVAIVVVFVWAPTVTGQFARLSSLARVRLPAYPVDTVRLAGAKTSLTYLVWNVETALNVSLPKNPLTDTGNPLVVSILWSAETSAPVVPRPRLRVNV